MSIELKDLYWAAGVLDTSGSIDGRLHVKSQHSQFYTSRIAIHQTNRTDVLNKMQRLFGGSIYRNCIWYVGTRTARGLMMTLYPLLTSERQRVIREVLLKDQGTQHIIKIRAVVKHVKKETKIWAKKEYHRKWHKIHKDQQREKRRERRLLQTSTLRGFAPMNNFQGTSVQS